MWLAILYFERIVLVIFSLSHPSCIEGYQVMKTLICVTLVVSALASPVLTFAQSSSVQLSRAQVRAEIVSVEQAGYRPGGGDNDYPVEIQAVEAKIAAQADAEGGAAQIGSSQKALTSH
jgi:hypothetical protein